MPDLAIQQRPFTAAEYHAMAQAGILTEADRVELIDGLIIAMSPSGSRHVACINRMNELLAAHVAGQAIVSVQNPIRLDDFSEPEPDVALLRPRADFYEEALAGSEDVLLIVEVADTSLAFDREVKVPRYAAAGIPEVWLVALDEGRVEVYRHPGAEGYDARMEVARGEGLEIAALPAVDSISVQAVLGRSRT